MLCRKTSKIPFMTDGEAQLHQDCGQYSHLILCVYIFFFCLVCYQSLHVQNLLTFMMQLRELQQQCYSEYSEPSWNIGNTTMKWIAAINVLLQLQQNSVNLTCMGPDMCYIIKYTKLSDGNYTDLHSYRTVSYCPLLGLYN